MLSRLFGRNGDGEPALHYTRTRDGVRIALYNYRPKDPESSGNPVFLCHGMGSNRYDLDYPGRQSLARYLHARGHDVWLIELRGAGRSSAPSIFNGFGTWVFDDYVNHDIPAGVRFIQKATGKKHIHWVGHSMGGMLAYPFLLRSDPDLVKSCVAVGAPSLVVMGENAPQILRVVRRLLKYLPYFPYRHTLRLLSPLLPLLEGVVGTRFYNPENMDRKVVLNLIRIALHNLPTSLMVQAIDWYVNQDCRDFYQMLSFTENLHRIETPLLIVGGALDNLTPPEDLRVIYDRVSSTSKSFVVMGRDRGDRLDYGHVDLILGENAPDEVFPLIQDWIARHEVAAVSRSG